ncbi:transcriptional regulator (plasmid) [Mesorhizobium sp. NBSH29]|uniref:transcriptional repressor TraM n=1 Tax=Mesorhizobium sp. NBSH29 TaxID=2654249 RepID=UPI0018968FBB|nr:transcriptional repressor TraM [Mesorhizobium sp. NBSH29]QPC88923.1 transcriptional regulator [Mesorhizobium sp. NBSH29]
MSDDKNGSVQPEQKLVLRPVVGLTENLPKDELEQIVVQAIKAHRRLRDLAEVRQDEWHAIEAHAAATGTEPSRIAYVTAMIDMHAQQTVLSTLLDVLGYIPSVPGD